MAASAAEGEIRAAEAELYRAMIARDFSALRRILADGVVYVHSTGVAETKAEYLAGVDRRLYDYETIASRNVRIVVDRDTAFMTGICDMKVGAFDRPPAMTHLLFVLVWARQAGEWRLEYRQATRIP